MSKHKKIDLKGKSEVEKKAKWADDPSQEPRQQTALWSFRLFDPYDWRDPSKGDAPTQLFAAIEHFKSCEGRTWGEIEANRGKDHPTDISRITKAARKRLEDLKQDDIEKLYRIRFTGKTRLWGIRDGRVFRVIWWDPHHAVCPD